jgi:hypothetical protein
MRRDRGFIQQRLGDGVESVQQAMPLGLGDVDGEGFFVGFGVEREFQGFEVDGDLDSASACLGDDLPFLDREFDREEAIAVGVAFEDIGEAFPFDGGDHRSKASLGDGPDGVLSARSAAEVLSSQEDRRSLSFGLVEEEFGVERAVLVGIVGLGRGSGKVAFVGEEEGAVAGPLDSLEVAGGDDEVGVDVGPVEDRDFPSVRLERFHRVLSSPGPASSEHPQNDRPQPQQRPSPG